MPRAAASPIPSRMDFDLHARQVGARARRPAPRETRRVWCRTVVRSPPRVPHWRTASCDYTLPAGSCGHHPILTAYEGVPIPCRSLSGRASAREQHLCARTPASATAPATLCPRDQGTAGGALGQVAAVGGWNVPPVTCECGHVTEGPPRSPAWRSTQSVTDLARVITQNPLCFHTSTVVRLAFGGGVFAR
jgi:hypothetical protein